MRNGVRLGVEIVRILRFVDAHAPQDDRWMVPVAANHAANVIDRDLLPRQVADMLPPGNLFENQQSEFIACVEKIWGLRIVRGTYDVALQFPFQDVGIAALRTRSHRLSDIWERLMPIEPAQLDDFSVQLEAMIRELRLAEADASAVF